MRQSFWYPFQVTETATNSATSWMVEKFPIKLNGLVEKDNKEVYLVGSSSWFSLVPFFSSTQDFKRPQLLVFSNESEMESFIKAICFFNPEIEAHSLNGFDVSPYSQLYPHPQLMCQRMNWLYRAQNATSQEIFLTTIHGLSQLTLPMEELLEHTHLFQLNDELPNNFSEFLNRYGYHSVSYVEDPGSYCIRGGIIDIYSPAHKKPVRIELFGDFVESLRQFDPSSQRSTDDINQLIIIPTKETLFTKERRQDIAKKIKSNNKDSTNEKLSSILSSISRGIYFQGIDFYLPYFYESCDQVLNHFSQSVDLWFLNPMDVTQKLDTYLEELKQEQKSTPSLAPSPHELFIKFDDLSLPESSRKIYVSKIDLYRQTPKKKPLTIAPKISITLSVYAKRL